MIEATHGPFATAQMSVPTGHGFNGETVYRSPERHTSITCTRTTSR